MVGWGEIKWPLGVCVFAVVVALVSGETRAQDTGQRAGSVYASNTNAPKKRPSNDTYFMYKDGVVTLTNQPSQYRGNSSYTEIEIEYRPIVVPGRYKFAGGSGEYSRDEVNRLVSEYARQYKLDENLVLAIIHVESGFDQFAVSRAGAQGLMQIMPDTARQMRVRDSFDAAQNIAAGSQYFAKMLEVFENDLTLAIAAYNAGPDAVKRYKGIPPYKETRDYVARVKKRAEEIARERAASEAEAKSTARK